ICHGPWVLSDAGLLKGRRATAWWPIRRDLENAGATFIDEPVVVDGNIITSRAPIDLAAFVHAVGERLAETRRPVCTENLIRYAGSNSAILVMKAAENRP